jgi:hypothetical protein
MDTFANPYPGARPLRSNETQLLRGRADNVAELIDAIAAMEVVEFTAPSGLGKSSLLDAGVVPGLRAEGFEVGPLRSWGGLPAPKHGGGGDVGPMTEFYAAAVRAAVRAGHIGDGGLQGTKLLRYLADTYGDALVIIFDQVEELLRVDTALGRGFLERVAFAARVYGFHQVVSLRSEFKEELGGLEENLRYNQWKWVRLGQVEDDIAREIVLVPLDRGDGTTVFSWEKACVDQVVNWWKAARQQDWKVGLLHLQAFLWSVAEQLRPDAAVPVTETGLRGLILRWLRTDAESLTDSADIDPVALFRTALTVYVELRLGTPRIVTDPDRRQELYAAARYSSELSSAGFKLVRDTLELARFAFPGVKGELNFSDSFIEEAVRMAERHLVSGDPEAELAKMATTLPGDLRKARRQRSMVVPIGDRDSTAGSMAGGSALEAACAEIAAYERSLHLLAEQSLVRVTPGFDGSRRVALIHDGFGDAMETWGKKVGRDPLAAIESTTALSAKQLLQGLGKPGLNPKRLTVLGSDTINHVRWIGCYIAANIRNVVFRNCRFSSTLFRSCVFENVRFIDCEFRGALFLECVFMGEEGTVIEVRNDPVARERCRISAITVKLSGMKDAGLTFVGMIGSGLLFEECFGGPWKLVNCDVRHVSMDGSVVVPEKSRVPEGFDVPGSREPLSGSVEGRSSILHLSLSGDVVPKVSVKDSTVRLVSYGEDQEFVREGKSTIEFTLRLDDRGRPISAPPGDN